MIVPTPSLPVPFYILCGSLGAGKTTLLMRLLEFWNRQNQRVGVLMNEAGEISIDGPRVGVIARVLCAFPAVNIRLTPLMRRLGRRGQQTMARRTPTT